MARMPRRCALVLLTLALASCTRDQERLTPEQRRVMREHVSTSAPFPRHALDLLFDERVRLIGYDLGSGEWLPGSPLSVIWYWEVIAPPRSGAELATEVVDPITGRTVRMVGTSPVRELFPPEHWRAGHFVRDEQTLALPPGWSAPYAMLQTRLDVGNESSDDGFALSISTPNGAVPSRTVRTFDVVETKTAPRLDGSLSDAVWAFAESTDSPSGAAVKMLWDSRFLYVGTSLGASVDVPDGAKVSRACPAGCTKLLFVPDGAGSNIFEFQVSSDGTVFESRFTRDGGASSHGHRDGSGRSRAAVAATASGGNVVEVAIPWQAFSPNATAFSPPSPGDLWRYDAEVIDTWHGSRESASGAPPATRDFHVPGRFGILRFEGAPNDMQGSSAPIELPEGVMPATMRRSVSPDVRESLLERNAAERNRIDAVRARSRESQ